MHLKSILNRVERQKCFVSKHVRFVDGAIDQEILQYNLESVRAHLLREDFQRFWEYPSPEWAASLRISMSRAWSGNRLFSLEFSFWSS
jgi:transposase